ncbi:MAG: OmpA family protein, partial [Pseudomonadota bacterium]
EVISMYKYTNNILIGALFSLLIAISLPSQAQDDYKGGYLVDKQGNPVATKNGPCLQTPKQPKNADIAAKCGGSNDSDGDGVPDDKDECPDTPEGITVNEKGCALDSDGDGVPDSQDKCPGTPPNAEVNKEGCPLDLDGDGVPDHRDRCPRTPHGATVDQYGCTPDVRVILTEDMVGFDTNQSTIKPTAKAVLNELAVEINENMSTVQEIRVIGHTDNTGEENYNQRLSERRAQAVVNYLIGQGIPGDRIYSEGKGESNPIDSNSTEDGRARNRRTEIDIKRVRK